MLFALIVISAIFVPLGISGAITYFVYKHSEWIKQKNKTKEFDFKKFLISIYAILMTIILISLFIYLLINNPVKISV